MQPSTSDRLTKKENNTYTYKYICTHLHIGAAPWRLECADSIAARVRNARDEINDRHCGVEDVVA